MEGPRAGIAARLSVDHHPVVCYGQAFLNASMWGDTALHKLLGM